MWHDSRAKNTRAEKEALILTMAEDGDILKTSPTDVSLIKESSIQKQTTTPRTNAMTKLKCS
jgi:hypothetical protein